VRWWAIASVSVTICVIGLFLARPWAGRASPSASPDGSTARRLITVRDEIQPPAEFRRLSEGSGCRQGWPCEPTQIFSLYVAERGAADCDDAFETFRSLSASTPDVKERCEPEAVYGGTHLAVEVVSCRPGGGEGKCLLVRVWDS
jgi:hypothetical protein